MEARTEPTRSWVLLLRLLVSAGLLAFLFVQVGDDITWSELLPEWSRSSVLWLLGAGLLTFLSFVLSTMRWQQVIHALDLRGRLSRLLSHFLAGQFISNVLPGTIGGDVIRVARLSKDTSDGPGSFASVVLERLTGWLVLPLITFLGFVIDPALRDLGRQTRIAVLIATGTLVALAVLLYAVDHPKLGGRFAEREGWTRFAGAVHLGFGRLRRHPTAAFLVIGVGLLYQLVLVASVLFAARALGMDVGFTALMAFFPAVLIAQVLPLSIAGLGIREFLLVFFLSRLGVPEAQALALGLLIFVLTLVVSLTGAPAYALGGGTPRQIEEAVL